MLSLPAYLLGVAEVIAIAAALGTGASALRRRLVPEWSGPPGWLATGVLAVAMLIWVCELLGALGLFAEVPLVLCAMALGLLVRFGLSASA